MGMPFSCGPCESIGPEVDKVFSPSKAQEYRDSVTTIYANLMARAEARSDRSLLEQNEHHVL